MDEQLRSLIVNLVKKTNESKLRWDKTSRDNEFMVTLDSGSITVDDFWATDEFSGEEERVLDLCILNAQGKQIERFYYERSGLEEFKSLQELHSIVYRKYHRIDEVINSILDDIVKL